MQIQFSSQDLLRAFSGFPTGVAVVTGVNTSGEPIGITVSSFSTVSLSPPLILWSIKNISSLKKYFGIGKRQLIQILEASQNEIALIFAKQINKDIHSLKHSISSNGLFRIADCVVYFECETVAIHCEGDHEIIVAKVLGIENHPDKQPMVFFNSKFSRVTIE